MSIRNWMSWKLGMRVGLAAVVAAIGGGYWFWQNCSIVQVITPTGVSVSISAGFCDGGEVNGSIVWNCYSLPGKRRLTVSNSTGSKEYFVEVGPDQYLSFDENLDPQ